MKVIATWQDRMPPDCGDGMYFANKEASRNAEAAELREALKMAQEDRDKWKARAERRVADIRLMARQHIEHTEALQAKLSAIEAQEPVAWVTTIDAKRCVLAIGHALDDTPNGTKLYAAPVAPAQPSDTFIKERAQLEAEWVLLRQMQRAYKSAQPVNELVEALKCLIATHWPLEEATSSDGCYTDDPNEIKARKALANAKAAQPVQGTADAIEKFKQLMHASSPEELETARTVFGDLLGLVPAKPLTKEQNNCGELERPCLPCYTDKGDCEKNLIVPSLTLAEPAYLTISMQLDEVSDKVKFSKQAVEMCIAPASLVLEESLRMFNNLRNANEIKKANNANN